MLRKKSIPQHLESIYMAVSQDNEHGWFLLQVGSWHIKWSKVDGMLSLFQNEAERTNVILREASW